MSSYSRRFLLCLPLALAACDFRPVYGPGGAGRALDGKVGLDEPTNEDSYLIARALEERLGRASSPVYHLAVTTRVEEQGSAVTPAGAITRVNLVGRATYRLTQGEATLATGDVRNFTGYSATGTTVEALAAETDARERLMAILAEQIVVRLFATPGIGA